MALTFKYLPTKVDVVLGNTTPSVPSYEFGYPAAQNYEPNVRLQLCFLESDANILVDTVGGAQIPLNDTYDVLTELSLPPPYDKLGGVLCGSAFPSGTTSWWQANALPQLDIGPSDHAVFEAWLQAQGQTGAFTYLPCGIFATHFGETPGLLNPIFYFNTSYKMDMALAMYIYADSGPGIWFQENKAPFSSKAMLDGKPHKIRIVMNRTDSTLKWYIDKVLWFDQDISPFSGKSFTNGGLMLPTIWLPNNCWKEVILRELRISIGTDVLNNDSGGPDANP